MIAVTLPSTQKKQFIAVSWYLFENKISENATSWILDQCVIEYKELSKKGISCWFSSEHTICVVSVTFLHL
jgi:hypothetical protein